MSGHAWTMWRMAWLLLHRPPKVIGPPVLDGADRFDIFPDEEDYAAATHTHGASTDLARCISDTLGQTGTKPVPAPEMSDSGPLPGWPLFG